MSLANFQQSRTAALPVTTGRFGGRTFASSA